MGAIRSIAVITFLVLATVVAQAQQTRIPACTGATSGVSDTAKIQAIVTATSPNDVTITLPAAGTSNKQCRVNTLSLPARVTIDNVDGSGFFINAGQTLTIAGSVISPPNKTIYFGTGSIVHTGALFVSNDDPRLQVATTNGPGLMPTLTGDPSKCFVGDGTQIPCPGSVGSGLTSLNGQTGSTQTFATDGNLTVSSASNVHTLSTASNVPLKNSTNVFSGANTFIFPTLTAVPVSETVLKLQNTGATAITLTLPAAGFSGYQLRLPIGSTATAGQFLTVQSNSGGEVVTQFVTQPLVPVTSGGTGLTTLPANNLLKGNGTSAVGSIAPGPDGWPLISNGGVLWASGQLAIGGIATSSLTGNGTKLATNTGGTSSGKCVEWDASGNLVTAASNAACGTGTGGGGGGVSTVSNVGTGGVGVSNGVVGSDAQLKNIRAASTKISATANGGLNTIDLDVPTATTSQLGAAKLSVTGTDTAVGTTDLRVPTQDENDALAAITQPSGFVQLPSTSNRYVTDLDPRVNAEAMMSAYNSFALAVTSIGAGNATLVIDSATIGGGTVSSNLTVPSNLSLRFTGAGQLSVSAGVTLTIPAKNIVAPHNRQIFTGAGSVVLTGGGDVYADWFAGSDLGVKIGTASAAASGAPTMIHAEGGGTFATQFTLAATHTLKLGAGTYALNSSGGVAGGGVNQAVILLGDNSTLEGEGDSTIIVENSTPNCAASTCRYEVVRSLASTTAPGNTNKASNIHIRNVQFQGVSTNPNDGGVAATINFGNCDNCTVSDSLFNRVSGYSAQYGGNADTSKSAGSGVFTRNRAINLMSQNVAVITGENVSITHNQFKDPGLPPVAISGASGSGTITITTAVANAVTTGVTVTIAGVRGCTGANGSFSATRTSPTTFTISGTCGGTYVAGSGVMAIDYALAVVDIEPNGYITKERVRAIDISNNLFDLRFGTAGSYAIAHSITAAGMPNEGANISNNIILGRTAGVTITTCTNASPIVCTTATGHELVTGDYVTITGVNGNTAANGTWTATVTMGGGETGGTTISLDGSTGNGAFTSSPSAKAVKFTGGGSTTGGIASNGYGVTISDNTLIRVGANALNLGGSNMVIEGNNIIDSGAASSAVQFASLTNSRFINNTLNDAVAGVGNSSIYETGTNTGNFVGNNKLWFIWHQSGTSTNNTYQDNYLVSATSTNTQGLLETTNSNLNTYIDNTTQPTDGVQRRGIVLVGANSKKLSHNFTSLTGTVSREASALNPTASGLALGSASLPWAVTSTSLVNGYTTLSSGAGHTPISIQNTNVTGQTAGENAGIYIDVAPSRTGTPAADNPIALTARVSNLVTGYPTNGGAWAANFLMLEDPSGLAGQVRVAEFELACNKTGGANPWAAGNRCNNLELVSHAASTVNPTSYFMTWQPSNTSTAGWPLLGGGISRVKNVGLYFTNSPAGSTDTVQAFQTAVLHDDSQSAATIKISGNHTAFGTGSAIDLSDNPTLTYFIRGASSAATLLNFANGVNQDFYIQIGAGAGTPKEAMLAFYDNATLTWKAGKNASNDYVIGNSAGVAPLLFGGAATGAFTQMRGTSTPVLGVTTANGANHNVAVTTSSGSSLVRYNYVRLAGPTGAFSITGFAGGLDGYTLTVYSSVAQALSFDNLSASSTAGNRIVTMTGGTVTLAASISSATFIYDSAADSGSGAWVLLSARDSAGAH